ncbi:23S rRNA (uracil(1939)-C(5))-methyltransferase RlmD [Marinicella sp. S1101]|uniref:23S rRNA (uracil(1939)-C(5))-methyltransferase RlmD n=1 Tax=Marinicella marina TaxID=2996016 RepID=UPI002260C433|nr:23S rRNA (uracil(1939)-C(5))-methyltransferase RlmD [Marinicella marina]MCX7554148.1 23S rRNA (uracil(1939)-C(5))-methyltransferase RlmD [Marinicella marina]MDJ1141159.1 23S rRNA (uracil(1939)-C(5))-methyltransferase RlmD [Marinicella marina]
MGRRSRNKLPQEPVELTIEDLTHDGRGVAKWNEKVVFVQNALPGEVVMAKLNRKTRNYNEALAVEILKASDDRVEPKCEFYTVCNGCSMMHLKESKQIEFKFNTLKSNFHKMSHVEPETWLSPLTDSHWNYRRRARLSVKWVTAKDKMLVGFREKNGRFVADMNHCLVLEKPLADLLQPLADLFAQTTIKQFIPQVECSMGDNVTSLIIRHMKPFESDDLMLIKKFADKHQLQIYLQSKGPKTVIGLEAYAEQLNFKLPEQNLTYEFLPNDFIQVNRHMNEKMIEQALTAMEIESEDVVLDLFCGLGNFTLPMAQRAAEVVGVEGDEQLVVRAKHNAALNQIENAEFYMADLTEDQDNSPWFKQQYSKVLIDPPRSGAWEILPLIAQTTAKKLIYVSCHPASLARDTDRLVNELGFKLEKAGVMDMFPHTSHVESMAIFTRD